MANNLAAFFKSLLEGFRSDSNTTSSGIDKGLTDDDSELTQRKIYGEALYHELEYQRHVKQMQDFEIEYNRQHRRLRDSACERNMHLRVMKLPAEILSLIFHCMRLKSCKDNLIPCETFAFMQRTTNWVSITWVCRYWRSVALNDPTLWTVVPDRWSMWTPEIIQRSQNAGLKVLFTDNGSPLNYTDVLKHSARIEQLDLSNATLNFIITHLSLGATPRLERLSIRGSVRPYLAVQGELNDIFGDCENLRYLDLTRMHVVLSPKPLPSIIRSSLRHLRLSGCSLEPEDFKPAINKIACLESLLLHNTLSLYPIPSSDAPIALMHLKSLDLDENPAELLWVFNNFILTTQLKHIRVVTRLRSEQNGDLIKLLTAMSRSEALAHPISTAHSVALEMDWLSEPGAHALILKGTYASTHTSDSAHPIPDESRDLTIVLAQRPPSPFPLHLRYKIFHGIFTDVYRHFKWTHLRKLDLTRLDGNFSPVTLGKTLQATFGALPDIRVVHVGVRCARPLVDALWLDVRQRRRNLNDAQRKGVSFRGLQEIYVSEISFNPEREGEEQIDLARFVDCLQGRVERGVPVKKLDFASCLAMTRHHVDVFMDIVPDVVWDGKYVADLLTSEGSRSESDDFDEDTSEEDDRGDQDSSEDDNSDEDEDSSEDDSNEDEGTNEHQDERDDEESDDSSDSNSSSGSEYVALAPRRRK